MRIAVEWKEPLVYGELALAKQGAEIDAAFNRIEQALETLEVVANERRRAVASSGNK